MKAGRKGGGGEGGGSEGGEKRGEEERGELPTATRRASEEQQREKRGPVASRLEQVRGGRCTEEGSPGLEKVRRRPEASARRAADEGRGRTERRVEGGPF